MIGNSRASSRASSREQLKPKLAQVTAQAVDGGGSLLLHVSDLLRCRPVLRSAKEAVTNVG
jgi:hypothetical protein